MPQFDPERALRRLRAHPTGRWVFARIGALAMRAVRLSIRWTVIGAEHRDGVLRAGGPVVAAFWHGRLFFSPFWAPAGRRTIAVISHNSDGALIAETVAQFGVESVRGSTFDPRKPDRDKGGREVFASALAGLQDGAVVAITPDGPRGPRMRAQPGVAALSVAAQAPVVPIAWSSRRAAMTRGWDRFLIPRPFDRGVLIYGAPLVPPQAGDPAAIECHRAAIEAALNAVTAEADRLAGRAPVHPAAAPAA